MKKNLIVGAAVSALLLLGLVLLLNRPAPQRDMGKEPGRRTPAPAKKVISKDKGVLIVKISNSKNKDVATRIRAFKAVDSRSSNYVTSFMSNRAQELPPGTYDLEIDTLPQKIVKGIEVSAARETTKELGNITASLLVKAVGAEKKDANYMVRVLYPKTNNLVAASTSTNKPVEMLSGVYDVEIGTLPKQVKRDVKLEAGKETVLDIGMTTGMLVVKAAGPDKKDGQYSVRISMLGSSRGAFSVSAGKPVELVSGTYNVELMSTPRQTKKDVKIDTGKKTVLEFSPQAQAAQSR